jgi:hypothetical protein
VKVLGARLCSRDSKNGISHDVVHAEAILSRAKLAFVDLNSFLTAFVLPCARHGYRGKALAASCFGKAHLLGAIWLTSWVTWCIFFQLVPASTENENNRSTSSVWI